jgi:hypothetical protein
MVTGSREHLYSLFTNLLESLTVSRVAFGQIQTKFVNEVNSKAGLLLEGEGSEATRLDD